METTKLTKKLARWALLLKEYEFEVVHRSAAVITTLMASADARFRPQPEHHRKAKTFVMLFLLFSLSSQPRCHTSVLPHTLRSTHNFCQRKTTLSKFGKISRLWSTSEITSTPSTSTSTQRDRIYRRALRYKWLGGNLYMIPHTGPLKLVPPLANRPCGHSSYPL